MSDSEIMNLGLMMDNGLPFIPYGFFYAIALELIF